ncbi:discoidin domain-containing protein [Streptomyces europaeiscabiei]|uniref:discoidin domain-containing protein n=1 Tax=Streptomyces europaeiscabiei TaxID=146819 RepID=UPI0029BBA029|nr:discoidin domain-containing protein [Streptomyces europaeiscabiei]MDX3616698.1 discoidin domain-containing protein [Streptomyces europaeiscabiei]
MPTYGGSQPVIKANGTTVFTGGSSTGSVSGLSYDGKDSSYVYFKVQPGTWTFTATGVGRLDDLALGRTVTSNSSLENTSWGRNRLTDGKLTSVSGARGYTSNEFASADVSANPVWVEIDLGADTDLDAVRLFPRTDTGGAGGGLPRRLHDPDAPRRIQHLHHRQNRHRPVQPERSRPDLHPHLHHRPLPAPDRDETRYPGLRREHQVPSAAGRDRHQVTRHAVAVARPALTRVPGRQPGEQRPLDERVRLRPGSCRCAVPG